MQVGYLPETSKAFAGKTKEAEVRLFPSIEHNTNHVLRELLPPQTSKFYGLRPRPHNSIAYVLPKKDDRNYIPRHLYNCLNKNETTYE